jgi:hypothetical protein
MNTHLIDSDVPTTELGVEDWPFNQLAGAGWPEQQALVLAANHDVEPAHRLRPAREGCDPTVAWEILL